LVGRPAAGLATLAVVLLATTVALPRRSVGQDAQEASPAPFPGAVALDSPVVPLPTECQTAPRTFEDLTALPSTPMALEELAAPTPPADLVQGIPADDATTEAVLAVIRESIACSNAGDLLRNFALFTDGYVRRRVIAVSGPIDQATYDAIVSPRPVAPDRYIQIVGVGQVLLLPGGRAAVEIVASDVRTRRSLILLVQTPDGWRIDELIPLEDSPAPATPPATPAA
jgi:hypothetical protein